MTRLTRSGRPVPPTPPGYADGPDIGLSMSMDHFNGDWSPCFKEFSRGPLLHGEDLFYYDGPLIWLARDRTGQAWLVYTLGYEEPREACRDRWALAPLTPEQVSELRGPEKKGDSLVARMLSRLPYFIVLVEDYSDLSDVLIVSETRLADGVLPPELQEIADNWSRKAAGTSPPMDEAVECVP